MGKGHPPAPLPCQLDKEHTIVSRTRPCTIRRNIATWCRSAAFSASSRLFDLNGETKTVRTKQSSASLRRSARSPNGHQPHRRRQTRRFPKFPYELLVHSGHGEYYQNVPSTARVAGAFGFLTLIHVLEGPASRVCIPAGRPASSTTCFLPLPMQRRFHPLAIGLQMTYSREGIEVQQQRRCRKLEMQGEQPPTRSWRIALHHVSIFGLVSFCQRFVGRGHYAVWVCRSVSKLSAAANSRLRSRSPLAADMSMRSARTVFDTMARVSRPRLFHASSRTSLKMLTVSGSKRTGSLAAIKYLSRLFSMAAKLLREGDHSPAGR